MRPRALLATVVLVLCAAGALGHVRLLHDALRTPLFWSSPASVGIVINSAGSDDISDGSHETALRMAIDEWNSAPGSSATLVENTSPASQARTDWWANDIHLILFDEDGSSGMLSPGTVAVTVYEYNGGGALTDADILFNGQYFGFTTSGQAGRFDVQDVGTHEIGHLIGFDHSAWAGATMYPYVDREMVLHRSISQDEMHALRAAYPLAAFARITGNVVRATGGSAVAGAHVVARDANGRTTTSVLTAANGSYTLLGLDPGTYTVYAVPLGTGAVSDAPVDASNLGSANVIQTDFATTAYVMPATITGTETVSMGTLAVADDVSLNMGTEMDSFPQHIVAGTSGLLQFRGTGLNAPGTVTASDPDLILGSPLFLGSSVRFQVTVPTGEEPGHVDFTVTNTFGESSTLPAALEITPPVPSVSGIAPGTGAEAGGTFVTINGADFSTGSHVVIGNQVYTDGVAGTTVVDPTTITLTTASTVNGVHDVVVIDPTGVEGRLSAGFLVQSVPVLSSVFPAAGTVGGGTGVVLSGSNFLAGVTVRIDGVDQGPVTVLGANEIGFTTTPGMLGWRPLTVQNPGGGTAGAGFTYGSQPDPTLSAVLPGSGQQAGGETVTVAGSGFTGSTMVTFGADPTTGTGGMPATGVTLIDGSTLEVVTPAFPWSGALSVMVSDPGTLQAHVVPAAFAVQAVGGSGGGCAIRPTRGPQGPRSVLLGGWWLVLVLLVLGERARRTRPATRRI